MKLGNFILNTEKSFLTSSYKNKMMTLQDITMRSKLIIPSSEDFKDTSKVILPKNQKSISKMQKYFDEAIMDKNQEISRLKVHNQKLLTQIKKLTSDKKSLKNNLDQLIKKKSLVDKETMIEPMELDKSSYVNNTIMDKGINIDPINLANQKDANPTNINRSTNFEVQTS
jgi:hypothetical protein